MLKKIKNYRHWLNWQRLTDLHFLGTVAFAVIVLLVSWSGIKAIQTNYELQKQIAALQQENRVKELENQNQKLRNQYLETDQFLELAARRQFGLAAPGETVVVIPRAVALAHAQPLPAAADEVETTVKSSKPKYQENFEAWIDFFLHRTDN